MQPLRVDPVLLGLPPAPPAPVPAATPAPVQEKPRVEVRPVDAPVVEVRAAETGEPGNIVPEAARPVAGKPKPRTKKAAPDEIPARAAAPAVAPEVVKSLPAPVPVEPTPVVTVAPAGRSRDEERASPSSTATESSRPPVAVVPAPRLPQPPAVAQPAPQPVARPASTAVMTSGTLPALQVHPGLLGMPQPVVEVAAGGGRRFCRSVRASAGHPAGQRGRHDAGKFAGIARTSGSARYATARGGGGRIASPVVGYQAAPGGGHRQP